MSMNVLTKIKLCVCVNVKLLSLHFFNVFKFILNNKVNETKNEHSAWEPITPFRLYETGFDKVRGAHPVVLVSVID